MVEAIFLSFEGVKAGLICTPKMDGDLTSNIFFVTIERYKFSFHALCASIVPLVAMRGQCDACRRSIGPDPTCMSFCTCRGLNFNVGRRLFHFE